MDTLYNQENQQMMLHAEAVTGKESNRIEKIKQYARTAGYQKIGIAHCISFKREADILKQYFSDCFEVFTIDCKIGRHQKIDFLGIDKKGISCNPAGQADFLAQNRTELNISMGLCVGHDIIFNQVSTAPVTTLFVKDRKHNHNLHHSLEEIQQKMY